jgi:hypothetical protein
MKEMERAKKEIQEREKKKALTQGAAGGPAAPRMNIRVRTLGCHSHPFDKTLLKPIKIARLLKIRLRKDGGTERRPETNTVCSGVPVTPLYSQSNRFLKYRYSL